MRALRWCPTGDLPAPSAVILGVCLTALLAACHRAPEPDAYGNVEATTVVVGAEASGRLLRFAPVEGARGRHVTLTPSEARGKGLHSDGIWLGQVQTLPLRYAQGQGDTCPQPAKSTHHRTSYPRVVSSRACACASSTRCAHSATRAASSSASRAT